MFKFRFNSKRRRGETLADNKCLPSWKLQKISSNMALQEARITVWSSSRAPDQNTYQVVGQLMDNSDVICILDARIPSAGRQAFRNAVLNGHATWHIMFTQIVVNWTLHQFGGVFLYDTTSPVGAILESERLTGRLVLEEFTPWSYVMRITVTNLALNAVILAVWLPTPTTTTGGAVRRDATMAALNLAMGQVPPTHEPILCVHVNAPQPVDLAPASAAFHYAQARQAWLQFQTQHQLVDVWRQQHPVSIENTTYQT